MVEKKHLRLVDPLPEAGPGQVFHTDGSSAFQNNPPEGTVSEAQEWTYSHHGKVAHHPKLNSSKAPIAQAEPSELALQEGVVTPISRLQVVREHAPELETEPIGLKVNIGKVARGAGKLVVGLLEEVRVLDRHKS